jgi:hypothetical protein
MTIAVIDRRHQMLVGKFGLRMFFLTTFNIGILRQAKKQGPRMAMQQFAGTSSTHSKASSCHSRTHLARTDWIDAGMLF